jgi:hypothetical protein
MLLVKNDDIWTKIAIKMRIALKYSDKKFIKLFKSTVYGRKICAYNGDRPKKRRKFDEKCGCTPAQEEKEAIKMANERTRKLRVIAALLALAMLLELMPLAALKAKAEETSYDDSVLFLDENGDQVSIAEWMAEHQQGQTPIIASGLSDDQDTLGSAGTTTWYVVSLAAWIDKSITITGDVRIILMDGYNSSSGNLSLNNIYIKGLTVSEGSSLTIYGESNEEMRAEKSANESTRWSKMTYFPGQLSINMWNDWDYSENAVISNYSEAKSGETGITIKDGGSLAVYGGQLDVKAVDVAIEGGTVTIGGGIVKVNPRTGGTTVSNSSINSTVDISGGTLEMTQSPIIGDVTISGGTVSNCYYINGQATITGGTVNVGSLLSNAVVDGNAMITFSSALDESMDTSNWNCLAMYDWETMQVYGNVTLTEDTEIQEDETLYIPEGSTLTLADGVTLKISKINNEGLILLGDGAQLLTSGGAEIVSDDDTEGNLGAVKTVAQLEAEEAAKNAEQNASQNTPQKDAATQDNKQDNSEKQESNGGALIALLLGGGIAVGTVVYFYVRTLRAQAAEKAATEEVATEEVTEEATEETTEEAASEATTEDASAAA